MRQMMTDEGFSFFSSVDEPFLMLKACWGRKYNQPRLRLSHKSLIFLPSDTHLSISGVWVSLPTPDRERESERARGQKCIFWF